MNSGYNTTSPLPFDQARTICQDLLVSKDWKFGLFWALGIYTALRISDILSITWEDLRSNSIKMVVKEKKTQKYRIIKVNKSLSTIVSRVLVDNVSSGFVFTNPKGIPYSREWYNKKIKKTLKSYDIDSEMQSSHCLRKTFSSELYKQTKNLWLVSKVLNHTNPSVTMRYIGMTQSDINDAYDLVV